jgi:hypothetical protein
MYDLDGRKGCSWRKPWKCAKAAKHVIDSPIFQTVVTAGICAATAGSGCLLANRAFAVYNTVRDCGGSVRSCMYSALTNYGGYKLKTKTFRSYRGHSLGRHKHGSAYVHYLPKGGRRPAYLKAFARNGAIGGAYSYATARGGDRFRD